MTRFASLVLSALLLVAAPARAHLWHVVYATAQTSDSNSATPTAIAGLSFSIAASTNVLAHCYIVSTSADATTGIRYAVTGPSSPTAVTLTVETWTTTAKLAERYSAANFSFTSAATSSIVTERQINEVTLMVRNGSNAGTIALTINPEANTQVTAEIGSWCEYRYQLP